MSLDLGFDDAQQAIAAALDAFCADHCGDAAVKGAAERFPSELWKAVAELGVLSLAAPGGDGGALEVVAAMESLGRAVFPGPLAATFLAAQVLAQPERDDVTSGAAVVSVGRPPLMPWAPVASIFLEVEDSRLFRCEARGPVEPVATLGGEPWGRVELERRGEIAAPLRGLLLYDIALAAYAAAAGLRLVHATADHARTRRQFGRPIGEFQAVAHPLADRFMELSAAAALARAAAYHFDVDAAGAACAAAAARLSASRAALAAAHTAHQLFGAVGITLEGDVFHVSRRIRQLASGPPGDACARGALLGDLGL